jgi:hypothetical protein
MDMRRPVRVDMHGAVIMSRLGWGVQIGPHDGICWRNTSQRHVKRKRQYRGQHDKRRNSPRPKWRTQTQCENLLFSPFGGLHNSVVRRRTIFPGAVPYSRTLAFPLPYHWAATLKRKC